MNPFQSRKLLKQLEPHRSEEVLVDGLAIPKSAAMLLSMLETETDPDNRYGIYRHILLECGLTDKTAAAVKYSLARYREFGDVTSLMSYSKALVENGEIVEGVARAREALDLAIKSRTLINFAAGNLMRQAVKTRSVDQINDALDALAGSTQMPRQGDCALETDWTAEAELLGADRELISWVRSVAARQQAKQ